LAKEEFKEQLQQGVNMSSFNDPAFIDWLSTLAISIGASLIIAGALAAWSGRLLGLAPGHKLWAFIVGFAFLCSLSTVPISEHGTWSDTFYLGMVPLLIVFIYFLPTAAAINGRHPNFQSIFIINLFFGWTLAGWLVALFSAVRRPTEVEGAKFRMTAFGVVTNNKAADQPQSAR
jgi:Na+-transporting NADH:ubiquinone oxidoreductase subunit NqrB